RTSELVLYAWPEFKYSSSVFGSPPTLRTPSIFSQLSGLGTWVALREREAFGGAVTRCWWWWATTWCMPIYSAVVDMGLGVVIYLADPFQDPIYPTLRSGPSYAPTSITMGYSSTLAAIALSIGSTYAWGWGGGDDSGGSSSSGSSGYGSGSSGSSSSGFGGSAGFSIPFGGDFEKAQRAQIAHGVLASLAFVIFFPFGAISIRLFSFRGLLWFHAIVQVLAYLIYIAAFDCRKIGSAFYQSNITVLSTHLKHTRGSEHLTTFSETKTIRASTSMENYFCKTCGTLMYRRGERFPGLTILRTGTVDDLGLAEGRLRPQVEQFIERRVGWSKPIEGAAQVVGMHGPEDIEGIP
ncbi:hypothetical protein D6C90_09129, partial [Aureobasidium pullulans]